MCKKLVVREVIGSPLAVSSERAYPVFDMLLKNINNDEKTIIDFSNIKSLTTAFLNVAIGELYRVESRETLNTLLKIDTTTLSLVQFDKVKMVMDNSRKKYGVELEEKIDEVTLHGHND